MSTIASPLREWGRLGVLVLEHFCGGLEAATYALDEQYHGVFDALADCLQALTEETTIPENLRLYIDFEAMARDGGARPHKAARRDRRAALAHQSSERPSQSR